jgi:hypothetical protein
LEPAAFSTAPTDEWKPETAVRPLPLDAPPAVSAPIRIVPQPIVSASISEPVPLKADAENEHLPAPAAPASSRIAAAPPLPTTARQTQGIVSGKPVSGSVSQESVESGARLAAVKPESSLPVKKISGGAESPIPSATKTQTQSLPQVADTVKTSSIEPDLARTPAPGLAANRTEAESAPLIQKTLPLAAATGALQSSTALPHSNAAAASVQTESQIPSVLPVAAASVAPESSSEQLTAATGSEIPLTRSAKPGNPIPAANAGTDRRVAGTQAVAPAPAKGVAAPQATQENRPAQEQLAAPHLDAQAVSSSGTASIHDAQPSGTQAVPHPVSQANSQSALDLSGMRVGGNAVSPVSNNTNAGPMPRPDGRETFATLDAEPPSAPATWVHAGSSQAEAGFNDPNLGWVSVRADQAGGAIHATLVPGSNEAASALSSHLDGLNAYLDSRHSPVQSLTVGEPEGRSAAWGGDSGLNHGAQQGMSNGAQQGEGQNTGGYGQRSDPDSGLPIGLATEAVHAPVGVSSGAVLASAQNADYSNGAHISVIA